MGEKTATDPPEKVPTTEKEIERIGDIIKNARGTWFVLLGSLVFAAITLASVKDASFFITSEQTKLPLLGISVPITSFFWAGALLVTALYTYLHLYLVQLWDALGEADARIGDKPLADVIHPWLVSDAALRVRDKRRGDVKHRPAKRTWKNRWRRMRKGVRVRQKGFMKRFLRDHRVKRAEIMPQSSSQRGMSKIGNLVSVLLVWVLGLAVIFGFWWRSMPAHDIWLTGWLGALLIWSLYVFWRSGSYALARLGKNQTRFPAKALFFGCVCIITFISFVRAHHDIWGGDPRINRSELSEASKMTRKLGLVGKWNQYVMNFAQEFIRPARAEMPEVMFTQKPKDWKGLELAKQEFRLRWCMQMKKVVCAINPLVERAQFEQEEEKEFEKAWKEQWKALLASFNKPDLRRRRMEGADLRSAELEGVRLDNTRLQGADLTDAQMQGAVLRDAQMQSADLRNAQMQGADLSGAQMQGAVVSGAQMQDADFSGARMRKAVLLKAQLQGADFGDARMQSAALVSSQLQGASFVGAQMEEINLSGAKLQSADFLGAQMKDADLSGANVKDADFTSAKMKNADFGSAQMKGAVLWNAEMQGAVLENAQMQGTNLELAKLQGANLKHAQLQGIRDKTMLLQRTNLSYGELSGASLRFVDFKGAYVTDIVNFDKSFGDGSVELAEGMKRPEGWCKQVLSDAQYWGRYRRWLWEHKLTISYFPDAAEKHPQIPFSEPCPE